MPSTRMSSNARLRDVAATRYVTPLREGGSLPGLLEADDDGLYVTKFRGAGQGVLALVAEVIVGELARALGLLVPELVTVEIHPGSPRRARSRDPGSDRGQRRRQSRRRFPAGRARAAGGTGQPDRELAAEIVWLDALVTNVDRSARNPNMLLWHGRPWLIDHGAALYLQHQGLDPVEHADRPFPQIAEHVLLPHAGSIPDAEARLAPRVDRALLERVVSLVPAGWTDANAVGRYVENLSARAQSATFVREAEVARTTA